jgi:gliding motility-associated-like protein
MRKINPRRLIFNGKALRSFLFLLLLPAALSAQTFWTENFSNGCTANCNASTYTGPNGAWTVAVLAAEGTKPNQWFISCSEDGLPAGSCGSACSAGDPSLHVGSGVVAVICPAGDCGASYLASAQSKTDKRAQSPLIDCSLYSGITVSFDYIGKGQTCVTDFCDLQYSSDGGTTWNNLQTCLTAPTCPSGQGQWTAFSTTLPAICNNNPNVKIGFHWVNNNDNAGNDPSFAVDSVRLSVITSTNTITTGLIAGSPFCACSNVNVPFTSTGTFTAGNIYTAQLSNAAGSFAAPTSIGTLASTANAGTIAATIPCATPTGSGYRIRVVSSAPAVTGTDNGVNITINAPAVATFSYTATPYCSTAANPSPAFSGGGVAGTFTSTAGLVFVSAATGQVNLSASTAGTYTVTNTIAASGGCPAVTATSTITITSAPVGTFSYAGTPYCANAADPSPTFSGGGVAGTFTSAAGLVFVSAASGQVDLSASTPGTYTVTNTIAASGGCAAVTATSSITINPVQSAAFSYSASTYCQSGTDPTPAVTGTPGGTFSASPAGLSFTSTTTGQIDLSASALNTYTVTYTTPGPCGAISTASLTISTAPAATFSYTGTPYCANAADPSPTFSGGGSGGVFSSAAGLVFISPSSGQVDLSASTPGTYTVTNTIAASGGCASATATSSITISPVQDSSFSYSASTFCQSGADPTPIITGTAGGTFSASPAGIAFISTTTGEIDLSASALNTYTITYTTPGPCPSSSTVSLTITTSPVATFSYTGTPYCANGTDPLPTFSGGGSAGTFTSAAGLTFISPATGEVDLSTSIPGTYTVTNTIAASGGCPASTATSTITVSPVQDSSFSYSASTFCQSGADPTPLITGTAGGTFTASPAGIAFISTATGEIDLSASALNTYTITYTTPGPCASSSSVSFTITTAPAATFSYTGTPYCANATDPLPTFSGGGVAGTFTSTAGLTFINPATGEVDLSASAPGTYTVTNTIAASGGCPSSSDSSAITIDPAQDSTFSYSGSSFCQTGTEIPTITGTAGGSFSSTPAGLVFISTGTGEIDLAASAIGSYSVTYTTPGPCAGSLTVPITITPPPTADFSYTGTPYCQNDPNPSPSFVGSSTAGTFTVSPSGLVFVSPTTGQVNLGGSTSGTYTVTNTIAASGGCPAATGTATIVINQVPTISVNSPSVCNGQSTTLTASGATSYSWSSGGTSSTEAVSPTSSTTYTVTGTTGGCSNTALSIVTVTNCNVPVANFSGTPTVMCQAGCVSFTDLSTNSPTSWSWLFPGASPDTSSAQSPSNICYSADGSYDVTLIATNSSGSDTLTMPGYITVGAPVTVNITGNLLITSCEETVLTAVPGDGTYSWGPSGTLSSTSGASVIAKPPQTQEYYVTYTSPDGCTDSDTATVVVQDINTYFLPTGFTPNGDGINDQVHLHGRGIDYFTLKIFDRIGEKVFESSDLDKGWDGRLHGLPMNDGVFVYTLDITFCNGDRVKKHGDITLVK